MEMDSFYDPSLKQPEEYVAILRSREICHYFAQ